MEATSWNGLSTGFNGMRSHRCAFRTELYSCLLSRGDALFELCDALLCTDDLVRTLGDLALAPEHRRGHVPSTPG